MINPLSTHFKIVATNTGASTIQEAAEKAEVILFCDKHTYSKYQVANSKALDYLWRPVSRLFVESRGKDHVPMARPEILRSAVKWENSVAINAMYAEIDDEVALFLESFIKFYHFLDSASLLVKPLPGPKKTKTEKEFFKRLTELKKYPFFASVTFPTREEFDKSLIDPLVKSLAQKWYRAREENLRKGDLLIDAAAVERNRMLTDVLLKAHREGAKRIIGIAGSDHVKIPKEPTEATLPIVTAIENLYRALQEAGIPYLTLKATSKHLQSQASEAGLKRPAPIKSSEEIARKRQEVQRVEAPSGASSAGSASASSAGPAATAELEDSDDENPLFTFKDKIMAIHWETFTLFYSTTPSTTSFNQQANKLFHDIMRPVMEQGIGVFSSS